MDKKTMVVFPAAALPYLLEEAYRKGWNEHSGRPAAGSMITGEITEEQVKSWPKKITPYMEEIGLKLKTIKDLEEFFDEEEVQVTLTALKYDPEAKQEVYRDHLKRLFRKFINQNQQNG